MKDLSISKLKLGVIGGGQLGKMLSLAASNWDVLTYIIDPAVDCCAAPVFHHVQQGDFTKYDDLYNFGKDKNILTIEIEKVNIEALLDLEKDGVTIYPEPSVIQQIQDKGLQKQFYQQHNIPSSPFTVYANADEIRTAVANGELNYPFVQKSRKDGYDGKGVHVVNEVKDLDSLIESPCLVEEKVEIFKELAVIVARNSKGETIAYPTVEMEFNPTANLVEFLVCPAAISDEVEQVAQAMAKQVIEAYNMTGILAVELFLDKEGNVLVNEVAPRPHNSGHHTIESIHTSQYEQHLRAILGLPLGSTAIKCPSVMINILGSSGYAGPAKYVGLDECMAVDGFNLHIYGKETTKPFRKMGHATILDTDINKAKEKARNIQDKLKVIS